MARAHYILEKEDKNSVTIADVGQGATSSVTNDAEAVLLELHNNGVLKGRRLFYYDSEGQLDEIKHDGKGNFTGFAPGPGR